MLRRPLGILSKTCPIARIPRTGFHVGAHYSPTGEYEFSFEVLKLVSQVLINAVIGKVDV